MFINKYNARFYFNPFLPNGLFYPCKFDKSIYLLRGVWLVLMFELFSKEISVLNANSADSNPTSHSAASNLGLHCLPKSFFTMILGINGVKCIQIKHDKTNKMTCAPSEDSD